MGNRMENHKLAVMTLEKLELQCDEEPGIDMQQMVQL